MSLACQASLWFTTEQKAGEVTVTSSSTSVPVVLTPNPAPHPPAEPEDPTLGKRKASRITTDPETVPSVTQKRKRRRKVGPDQSISAVNNTAIVAEPPEPGPEAKRGVVPGDASVAPGTSAVAEGNRSVISQAQKKKKRKTTAGQSDSTSADPVGRRIEPSAEPADAPEPAPAEPQRTKKRKKTVVLDLSTVIHPPSTTQVCLHSLFSLHG